VLIYDDEIATGGSVIELCKRLQQSGIEELYVICTHGLFIGDALKKIAGIPEIKEIVTTDTVPIPPEKRLPNLTILSVAPVFGDAIRLNYTGQSIGELFAYWQE
jgi:ribose-phosphate pyrophosphokinase